jgi:HAE1 family hydrophobic/amphiphilic exporter-1
MTTATTTLGLLPMALGMGDGAELRTPMAIAVISGLVISTLLTLFIIPSIYTQVNRLRRALGGKELVFERTAHPGSEALPAEGTSYETS